MKNIGVYWIAFTFGYIAHTQGQPYWYVLVMLPVMYVLDKIIEKVFRKFKGKNINFQ